ncbi:DNA double-strand break repair Rad50 ATPase [uncultured archaeon]|nr:DNA double-strand break repair Rad50 ATPase [uncultured archaeon]
MLIKSVELRNIKSYSKESIDFFEGINGICGENGHGKTTILEAIGYTLFDFLPFGHSDFLRHGEKSGYVAVTVEGNDEVEYIIHRKIGSGSDYFVRTPVNEIKGKKDVLAWIAGNLFQSVKSEDELPALFENAIGVPQGTFTTSFLETVKARKMIFDNILRVEEYQVAYANMLPVINAIKKEIDSLERDIIPLRTRTENYPELKKEKESMQIEIDSLRAQSQKIKIDISSLTKKKEDLSAKKSRIDALNSQINSERVRIEGLGKQLEKARSDLARAESARKIMDSLEPVEEEFKKEKERQKGLNTARLKRDKLKNDIAKVELNIAGLLEKLKRSSQLANENAELEEHKKLLAPKVENAHRLEDSIRELQKELREPMAEIISHLLNLREKEKRIEDIKREIEEQELKISALLPLREKQLELEAKINESKDIVLSLVALSSEIKILKKKELQAGKLRDEISLFTSRKENLIPLVAKQKELEEEIKTLSNLLDSLSQLGFELRQALEKEERLRIISSEIRELEKSITALSPSIEKQKALEGRKQELSQQQATVKTQLEQIRSNMKLAGTGGLCPVFSGIKCSSVSDFSKYFNDEINLRNNRLKELDEQLKLVSEELKCLNDPIKQQEEKVVLISSKKKDLTAYEGVAEEVESCRVKIKALVLSYPSSGISTGSEEERRTIARKLNSEKAESEKLKGPVREAESIEALIKSKNADLEEFSSLPGEINGLKEKINQMNDRFGPDLGINNIDNHIDILNSEINSLEKSLKELKDPSRQVDMIRSFIESRKADIESLKNVPLMISSCLEQLDELNSKFHLKEKLLGDKDELLLADDLVENKKSQLKELNSPEKELESLNGIIKKNARELKTLEKTPELLESVRNEKQKIESDLLKFKGLDETIASLEEKIAGLEPEHNKYLQSLPLASKIDEYARECGNFEKNMALVNTALNELILNQEALLKEYSEVDLNDTILQLEELGKTASAVAEALKGKSKNLEKLARELAGMEKDLHKITDIEKRLENEKDFLFFSNFIRDTIKNSSEFVINEFIGEISIEASNIYCEIMDDYSSSLRWTNDYDIEIESAGEINSFKQLSGGERMSAALAVRLALLKVTSNCDFVFLDEPTQNMDEARRENLSEQITNIKGFKQVFVISHDDTFNEKYAHVVKIQKTDGESRVVPCST